MPTSAHTPLQQRAARAVAPTVVLTGASSGIGRATALAFARQGARLVLAARGQQGLDEVVAECERTGAEAIAVATDVTDAHAVTALANAAVERFGGFDVWINNVGVGAVGPYDTTPMEAHRRVIEANLIGHMNGAYAALPRFRRQRRGTLINMVSVGGWAVAPYAASYTASKFGVRGFSQGLRAELADLPDVHVCEVYPTFVDTPGMDHGANFTGKRLRPPPPVVDPRTVADVMVSLSRRPRPTTMVGSVALPARVATTLAPDLVARTAVRLADMAMRRADPAPMTDGNLFEPSQGHAIDGGYRVRPARALPVAALAGVVGLGLLWALRGQRSMR